MIADLDGLMRDRSIDVLIVPMHESIHPAFRWISRGAAITRGFAIKLPGDDPFLIATPLERDTAATTGLKVKLFNDYGFDTISKTASNPVALYADLLEAVLKGSGDHRTVGFAGNLPIHLYLGIADELGKRGFTVIKGTGEDIIQLARKRKEDWEIKNIRDAGVRTEQVIDLVRNVLRESKIDGSQVTYQGKPLKIGYLKQLVTTELVNRGLTEVWKTIIAHGRDAGIPHSFGNPDDVVRPGVPIVMDIFPFDPVTGYWFDETRTFCVGPPSDDLKRIHDDVLEAFTTARDKMTAGTNARDYQNFVCDQFEKKGYATIRSNPSTLEGYLHTLGHGVGLDIHERPAFGGADSNTDKIEVNDILTIEPGLYFPDKEIGVRIEDSFVINKDGKPESLCTGSRDLAP